MDFGALRAKLEPVLGKRESVRVAYLFGSHARGDARADSDLDFAVLFENPDLESFRSLWADIHDVLGSAPFDLVTLNNADPVLCFDVIREGKPLFWRSDDELNDFERRAWHRYQDTRHMRAIGDYYLLERAKEWSSSHSPSGNA